MRYVLDCSVAVRWFVAQTHADKAAHILDELATGQTTLVAPDVIVPEFGHVLRKLVVGKKLAPDRARPFLDRFLLLPIEMSSSRGLAPRALDLTFRHSATFYDALYLALAERENLKVVTADERMVNAFAGLERTVSLASFS